MTEAQGDGGSGGRRAEEENDPKPAEHGVVQLPHAQEVPPRAREPAVAGEDIFEQTPQRREISKSWQRALDRAGAGVPSNYTRAVDVRRQHIRAQNQAAAPSSDADVIHIDDDVIRIDDDVIRIDDDIILIDDDDDDDDTQMLDSQPASFPTAKAKR